MFIKYAFWLYISYAISIIVHELFHLIAALLLKISIQGVYIGEKFLRVSIGKLYISPIILSGYVVVESDDYRGINTPIICAFYLSGILGNIILILLSYYCIANSALSFWIILVNILSILFSLLPIISDNDIAMIIKLWRNNKKFKTY